MWIGVRERFRQFDQNTIITETQRDDGLSKQFNARLALQRHYYDTETDTPPGFLVGSWGKETQRRPPVDVDLFFEMPADEFARFNALSGNKQSSLLQEVKGVLQDKWGQTDIRGDGQVVQVNFNSLTLEIVPVFAALNGQYTMPDTNNGGSWLNVDPIAEINSIRTSDTDSSGDARRLMRMFKCWRDECNVGLESFAIEQMTRHFLSQSPYSGNGYFWYDWLSRDFFEFLIRYANGWITMPGTQRSIYLGDNWLSRAESAHKRAIVACDHELNDKIALAGEEWQKIFGTLVPIHV